LKSGPARGPARHGGGPSPAQDNRCFTRAPLDVIPRHDPAAPTSAAYRLSAGDVPAIREGACLAGLQNKDVAMWTSEVKV
jgi:hypothetical protein